jgi:hypothetical protein
MEDFVDTIKQMDEAIDWYKERYEQPLLRTEPKLDDAIAFVRSIVK